jgi:hypothetical protein
MDSTSSGKYLVIYHTSHDNMIPLLKIQIYKCQFCLEKVYGCLEDMCLDFLEFLEPYSINTKRNKKTKCYVNSVTMSFCDTMHVGFSLFCFFKCIPNLVLKILGSVNRYLVNIHNFILNFLKLSNSKFMLAITWYALRYSSMELTTSSPTKLS